MAKRNHNTVREHRMKQHEESGFTEGNSKYAQKRRLQMKGIYSPNSPFIAVLSKQTKNRQQEEKNILDDANREMFGDDAEYLENAGIDNLGAK